MGHQRYLFDPHDLPTLGFDHADIVHDALTV